MKTQMCKISKGLAWYENKARIKETSLSSNLTKESKLSVVFCSQIYTCMHLHNSNS